jgi:hypothetical protein
MKLNPKRLIFGLSLSIAIAAFIYFLCGHFYDIRLERHFNRVASGMSEEQILSVMGKPDSIGKCGELGGVPDGCYREYFYKPMLPTISTWAVFFDSQGRAVGKYEYESP